MKQVVIFGEDWGRHMSTAQFIAGALLKKCQILWVDSLAYRVPDFGKKDIRRIIHKISTHFNGIASPEKNLFVFTPLLIPLQRLSLIRRFNSLLLRLYLRHFLKKLGFKDFTLMTAGPLAEPVIGRLGEKKSIYYCADHYGTLPGISPVMIDKLEKRLSKKVDVTIATSETLFELLTNSFSNVVYVPHGVDYHHFSRRRISPKDIPEEIRGLNRPVIGYHGLIQHILETRILEEIADLHPEWNLVLIGDTLFDAGSVPLRPNIHLLGKKPYEILPDYLGSFQVGLIPYKITKNTLFRNPVKLREYLAAGIPVVSTPLPESKRYEPHVKIAKTSKEFVSSIEYFLKNDNDLLKEQRMELMREESWERVAEKIYNELYESDAAH